LHVGRVLLHKVGRDELGHLGTSSRIGERFSTWLAHTGAATYPVTPGSGSTFAAV
jgi:hypothetical protein